MTSKNGPKEKDLKGKLTRRKNDEKEKFLENERRIFKEESEESREKYFEEKEILMTKGAKS